MCPGDGLEAVCFVGEDNIKIKHVSGPRLDTVTMFENDELKCPVVYLDASIITSRDFVIINYPNLLDRSLKSLKKPRNFHFAIQTS